MKKLIYCGFALITLTNIIVYAGVAYNRSTDTPQQLTLSERELSVPYNYNGEENSVVALRLNWQLANGLDEYPQYSSHQLKVDAQMLQLLGFDPQQIKHNKSYLAGVQTREVFWVMEFDGDSYQHYLELQKQRYAQQLADAQSRDNNEQAIERIEKDYRFAEQRASRLFVIDTGLDPEQLRKDYPSEQFIFLKGLVRAQWRESQGEVTEGFELVMQALSVPQIMVPSNFAEPLEDAHPTNYYSALTDNDQQIKFRARLAWGKRFEPWVVDISVL
jgi:hypothetical protein